jgi:PPOX class probable FMN-dependent enzyme
MRFEDTVQTLDQLREVIAPPSHFVTDKEVDRLDDHCIGFIEQSPFVLIASTDGRGRVDISPKGDAPGFVSILDEKTLAVPDRKGNHRADTFVNVLEHPWVGLIFLVPGHRNTLRVRGRAEIVRDPSVREQMAVGDSVPDLALGVHVTTAYFHCAKCIIRSRLWDAKGDDDDRLLARAMVEHGNLDVSVDEMDEMIKDDERTRLY